MTIDDITRQFVRRRANYRCEYCHSPERICTTRFTEEEDSIRGARRFWVKAGLHPPDEDPRQSPNPAQ